jgi:hypothetical protein
MDLFKCRGDDPGTEAAQTSLSYARSFFTTLPCTSVKRKSRPW